MKQSEIEKLLAGMSARKVEKFANNLQTLVIFLQKKELRKLLARQVTKMSDRLTALEKKHHLGDYKVGMRKGITEGECDTESSEEEPVLWPSLQQIL